MPKRLELLIPPPIVALLSALAMWGVAWAWPNLGSRFEHQAVLGYALIAIGIGFDLISIAGFLRARTTVTPLVPEKASTLVTDGLYRITRNPMYLGLLLILTGFAILRGSPINAIFLVTFVLYLNAFQIRPEEERLTKIFGADYESYKQRVRRWL
ncbi:MAG: isoprenylcysteine carboxylmethyltransferase family protein [Pseudomonadota bacterium]|jgi:protein-S-isoprenylcysteine O-methyltransferase Ste14